MAGDDTSGSEPDVAAHAWTASLSSVPGAEKLSGLEQLQGVAEGRLPQPPIAPVMGMALIDAGPERAVFRGTPEKRHRNLPGVVHGGWAALLLDSALGCAVHATLAPGELCATVSIEIKLVRQVTVERGPMIAEGRVMHRGKTQSTATGELRTEQDGLLVAHGTATVIMLT